MNIDLDNFPLPDKEYEIFPCTHTSLAKAYGVSRKVLYHRLRPFTAELGARQGYKYDLSQMLFIISKLGYPPHPLSPTPPQP